MGQPNLARSALLMLLATWLGIGNSELQAEEWGGTVISDQVPYQPAVLLDRWTDQTEPLDLEHVLAADPQVRLAGLTRDATAIATDLADHPDPQLPPGTRNGVFQKLLFTGTWLPPFDDEDVGFTDLETGVIFAFPFLRRDTPLLITPRYAVHLLDRPAALDLPSRLFDASFEFRHLRKFGEGPWAMDAAVTLGHYSDYEADDADAFRVSGRGLAVYEGTPGRKWVFGVAYLNRAGATVLPVGGAILDPSPDVSFELIFPRPRVSWRLPGSSPDGLDERWVYFGGEFGGGVWSIQRPLADTHDLLTSNDYRVLLGYERNIAGGVSRLFELGYVFGRELEFASGAPDIPLNDTLFARVGLKY